MKHFFYCNSYQSLYLAIEMQENQEDIVLITEKPDILRTCEALGLETLGLEKISTNDFLKKSKKVKSLLAIVMQEIEKGTFHFTHTQFDLFCFLILNKCKKREIPTVFYDIELVLNESKFRINLNYFLALYRSSILKIKYGLSVELRDLGKSVVLSLHSSAWKAKNIRIENLKNKYYDIVVSIIQKKKLKYGNSKIMFLGQNYTRSSQLDQKALSILYEFLDGVSMDIKHHPYMKEEDFFNSHFSLPTYLPSELLYYNKKLILSINSVGLVAASFMKGVKAVALMNLITIKDEVSRDKIKSYLMHESKGNILFPNTYEELKDIIEEI